MIEVRGLTKRYRDRIAVDHLTFAVNEGEILGFLGPNGAGKTTTMKILTGSLPASEGSAKIAGYDVFEAPLEIKRRIGYLPEFPPLYPEMTVAAYLRFVATLKGGASIAGLAPGFDSGRADRRVGSNPARGSPGPDQELGWQTHRDPLDPHPAGGDDDL